MRRVVQGRAGLALAFILGMVIATAGSATAAKLITGKQIKDGSISKKDLSSALRKELARTGRTGPRGRTGPEGIAGPRGPEGQQGLPGLSSGPAGGDLIGHYPSPKLRPPAEFGIKQQPAPPAPPADCETAFNTYCGSVGAGNLWDRPVDGGDGGYLVYTVDSHGFVEFSGAVQQIGNLVTYLFVLPPEHRPAVTHRLRITHHSNTSDAAYLTVEKDGHVRIVSGAFGPLQIFDLTGARYRIKAA